MGVDLLLALPRLYKGSALFSPPALITSGHAVRFLLSMLALPFFAGPGCTPGCAQVLE